MKKIRLLALLLTLSLLLCACGFGGISASKAKEIALADAGVSAADVTFTKEKTEKTLSSSEFEFRFEGNGKIWEYEIDGNGTITSKEVTTISASVVEAYSPASSGTSSDGMISEEEAKSIALNDAGVAESDVTVTKVKLERDDGIMQYEIEFSQGLNKEWEYEIDACTGAILKAEKDFS